MPEAIRSLDVLHGQIVSLHGFPSIEEAALCLKALKASDTNQAFA